MSRSLEGHYKRVIDYISGIDSSLKSRVYTRTHARAHNAMCASVDPPRIARDGIMSRYSPVFQPRYISVVEGSEAHSTGHTSRKSSRSVLDSL